MSSTNGTSNFNVNVCTLSFLGLPRMPYGFPREPYDSVESRCFRSGRPLPFFSKCTSVQNILIGFVVFVEGRGQWKSGAGGPGPRARQRGGTWPQASERRGGEEKNPRWKWAGESTTRNQPPRSSGSSLPVLAWRPPSSSPAFLSPSTELLL